MKSYKERATFHAGKRTKSGEVYSPNHNTVEKGRERQKHINAENFSKNEYIFFDTTEKKFIRVKGGHGGVNVMKHERAFAKEMFQESLDRLNERYAKDGHKEDMKTLIQYIKSKPPMEIITELGNVDSEMDLDLRGEIVKEATMNLFFKAEKTWPDNLKVLNISYHGDEGIIDKSMTTLSTHLHSRLWMFANGKDQARGKDGKPLYNEKNEPIMCKVPNQNAALEEMGFKVPKYRKGMTEQEIIAAVKNDDNWGSWAKKTELYRIAQENPMIIKHTRVCSPLVAFTDKLRDIFYNYLELSAKKRGVDLQIDREVKNKSYRQFIKQGKVNLSKDTLSSLERVDEHKGVEQYKEEQEKIQTMVSKLDLQSKMATNEKLQTEKQTLMAEISDLTAEKQTMEQMQAQYEKVTAEAKKRAQEAKERAANAEKNKLLIENWIELHKPENFGNMDDLKVMQELKKKCDDFEDQLVKSKNRLKVYDRLAVGYDSVGVPYSLNEFLEAAIQNSKTIAQIDATMDAVFSGLINGVTPYNLMERIKNHDFDIGRER